MTKKKTKWKEKEKKGREKGSAQNQTWDVRHTGLFRYRWATWNTVKKFFKIYY